MTYRLNLDVFEGPFDLLLYLIKKNEINIYDIPISQILEEFLEYVGMIQELDLEVAGDFILVAATLMHIKSRMLLPKESIALEEGEEVDPRADLVRRLLEYKRYKEVAESLDNREQEQRQVYWRHGARPSEDELQTAQPDAPPQFQELNLFDLLSAFKRVLAYAKADTLRELSRETVKTSQKINEILDLLEEQGEVDFFTFMLAQETRIGMIAAFLAMLELAKLQAIRIDQSGPFSEIKLKRVEEFARAGQPEEAFVKEEA